MSEARRTLHDILDDLPIRGTPGGWADPWDDPCPALVAQVLAERALVDQAALATLVREADASDGTGGPYGSILDGLDLDPFPG